METEQQEAQGNSAQLTLHGDSDVQHDPGDVSEHERLAASPGGQSEAAPASKEPEAGGVASAAASEPSHLHCTTAAAAQPAEAGVADVSEQPVSAASAEPASAAMASQSRCAEAEPPSAVCYPLQPDERKVAIALLVVLQRAQKDGRGSVAAVKAVLNSNLPLSTIFLEPLPDDGKLPSLQQVEGAMSKLQRDWLNLISDMCALAECQPLDLFTRSAQCSTHLEAIGSLACTKGAARQQRLQAIKTSLSISRAAERDVNTQESDMFEELLTKVDPLKQHGASRRTCFLIAFVLHETVLLLDADRNPQRHRHAAGSNSSFTACLDHMLPGR